MPDSESLSPTRPEARGEHVVPASPGASPAVTDADYRALVESVRDYAIFMLDAHGRVASWNAGAQINKGYTADEIIGRHFSVFYPQDEVDRGWPQRELEIAIREGRFEDEGWRIRKDGSRFWASVVITALFDDQGRHYGFGKVTRDMTAQRRIGVLESQEKHLQQFVAVLGHELRNPLAPIANAVQIMRMQELPPALHATRDVLGRQVTHLTRLVDDLLDVGRILGGKVHLAMEPLDLRQAACHSLETMSPQIDARGHRLDVNIPDVPLWVRGDHVRLVQVINNLLGNAAKFTPPGGRIGLSLGFNDGQAEISVDDNGPGIPPEEQAHVFKLFTQSDRTVDRHHGGLGIGLNMVHHLVQRHGGSISAFSTGEAGKGCEFVVHLPLLDHDDGDPPPR